MEDRGCRIRAALFVVVGLILTTSAALAAPPVTLLSRADAGAISDTGGGASESTSPGAISADGRYVVFSSSSDNLVPGQVDANFGFDVFLYDRATGTRTLVSHAAGAPATAANAFSLAPVLSADGRFVVYLSEATNLVAGQSSPPYFPNVFLYDRETGINLLVSHASGAPSTGGNDGGFGAVVSDDGAYVAFTSSSTDLVAGQSGSGRALFLYDRAAGTTTLVSHASGSPTTVSAGDVAGMGLSGDGRYLAFESSGGDLVAGQGGPAGANVFLYDRLAGTSLLVSHASGAPATGGNAQSFSPVLSADGGTVVFQSLATDLVAGLVDANGAEDADLFAYVRAKGASTLVSRSRGSFTTTANRASYSPALSADGRYVAFISKATDLVAGVTDGNGAYDVFLQDLSTGQATLVSRSSASALIPGDDASLGPTISADGRFIAYGSLATNLSPAQFDQNQSIDVFLYDRTSGTSSLVSALFDTPNGTVPGNSYSAQISADGAFVVWTNDAADVVPALDLNRAPDVFLYGRASQGNALVSARDKGLPALSAAGRSDLAGMSADGRFVAILSNASNLSPGEGYNASFTTQLFVADTQTGSLTLVSHDATNPLLTGNTSAVLSADGSRLAYVSEATDLVPGQSDAPATSDVFLHDRPSGATVLVSHRAGAANVAGNGGSVVPVVSADGRFVAYESVAPDLVAGQSDLAGSFDVFLYDREIGLNTLVSHRAGAPATAGSGNSFLPAVSADGRFVAYESAATDLVAGSTLAPGSSNVYLYDRLSGTNTLVSHTLGAPTTGAQGSGAALSADGRYVLFSSAGDSLAEGQADTNGVPDAFLWDRLTDRCTLVSHSAAAAAATGNGTSNGAALSADGRFALWNSNATNLLPGQVGSGQYDLFLYDRLADSSVLVSHADGAPATGVGFYAARLSADGAFVAWTTNATNAVPGQIDSNQGPDVFLYDRVAGTSDLLSRASGSPQTAGNSSGSAVAISADGSKIAFGSSASDLVAFDFNGEADVFLSIHALPGKAFFTLPPCRLLDTRQGGPALASGAVARFAAHHVACGIPDSARALAVNVTIAQPTGDGHLNFYPEDVTPPLASTINFAVGQTRANNAVLQLSLDGLGHFAASPFVVGNGTVELIVDVSGYFE